MTPRLHALAAALLAAGCISAAHAQPAAEIVSLSGRGESRPTADNGWQPAAVTQRLPAGADIRTLALSSAALLLADRTQIRMSANAQLRLNEAQPERTRLDLAVGRLWARTKKNPAALEIRTPAALGVVRGTDWDLEVDDAGRTTLTVLSGQIVLSNPQGEVEVGPAEQAYVEPGKAPVKRRLVQPRERVQWVMADPMSPQRYAEFRQPLPAGLAALAPPLRTGDLAALRQQVEALAAQPQPQAVVELLRADLRAWTGDLAAAEAGLAQAWQRQPEARLAARRADWLMAMDRMGDARAWLNQTASTHENTVPWQLTNADWYRLEGDAARALEGYERAVALAQNGSDKVEQALALSGLGRAQGERGDLNAARLTLARASQLAPDLPSVHGERAVASLEAGRVPEAREAVQRALALAGDDYVSLGSDGLLALREGDPARAREQLLKSLVIEPRLARAQVWLAVSEYQLGETAAALDSLERASLADPKDPLPWQIKSILLNDAGEPAAAIAASREALVRLPHLKSLNPLSSDSQGSANLGKALGDFGLEQWARAYASESYYPFWSGSHFFLADRYESSYNQRSELFQGYLTDPTVFGSSEKRASILPTPGVEWTGGLSAEDDGIHTKATGDIGLRGVATTPMPTAWLIRAENVQMWPKDNSYRLRSPGYDIAVGAKPHEQLSLFIVHNGDSLRFRYPQGRDLGNNITFRDEADTKTRRTDGGFSWRWTADSQTWFKTHSGLYRTRLALDDATWGPQYYAYRGEESGTFVRHTTLWQGHRISLGWERVETDAFSTIFDLLQATPQLNAERYRMPWVAAEWRFGPMTLYTEAYKPRFATAQGNFNFDPFTGEPYSDPILQSFEHPKRVLPRLGASYRFGPGRALHVAHLENVRAPGSHTLSPVAIGPIALDNQYTFSGSYSRKTAAQLDWELSSHSFMSASLQAQTIHNPQTASGSLYARSSAPLFDSVNSIAPVRLNAQTSINTYDQDPVFGHGQFWQLALGYNHILGPRWSVMGTYLRTESNNLGAGLQDLKLPGFARHVMLGQTTYQHGPRTFSLARVTWRGWRYTDEANTSARRPRASLTLAHARESADRRWSVVASAQNLGMRDVDPVYWLLVRMRY